MDYGRSIHYFEGRSAESENEDRAWSSCGGVAVGRGVLSKRRISQWKIYKDICGLKGQSGFKVNYVTDDRRLR